MIEWKLHIPARVAGPIEHLLMDPITRKPRYGQRSRLVTRLLEDFIRNNSDEACVDYLRALDEQAHAEASS